MNNLLYKICAGVLILSLIHLQAAMTVCAVQPTSAGKAEGITKHAPELLVSPEVNAPGEKEGAKEGAKTGTTETGKRSYTWLWWVLGAVVIAVAAAAGGGGGGGSSSGGGGTVVSTW
jgi:hypothetical protein